MTVQGAVSSAPTSQPAQGERRPARVVCFWIKQQLFGVTIDLVNEVIALQHITRIPLAPPWVAGIINLRGDVVSVLDLGAFLRLGMTKTTDSTRIVVVRAAQRTGGLIADRIDEVRTVDLAQLQPAPALGSKENQEFMAGLLTLGGEDDEDEATGSRAPLVVLDMPRLFESERIQQFARERGSDQ